jgi:hypothetical protein
MNEEKKMVPELIDVLILEGDKPFNYQNFSDKLQDLYNRNAHLSFETFDVRLERVKNLGDKFALTFVGNRKETNEEQKMREVLDAAKRKSIDEEELKLYLKLKKKFEKK